MTTSQFTRSFGGHRRSRRSLSGRALALLGVLAVALGAAFVVAPGVLAGRTPGGGYADEQALIRGMRTSFVEYWNSGDRHYPAGLQRIVGYWIDYHVVKVVTAATLLTVLIFLTSRLLRSLLAPGRLAAGRAAVLAASAVLAATAAVAAAVLVMANMQDVAAPFGSLISLLPVGSADTRFAHTVGQVRERLAAYPHLGRGTPPALQVMVGDYALYHAVLVALLAILAVVLITMSVASWRRRGRTAPSERRIRRTLAVAGLLLAVLVLAVIVVALANLSTVLHPAPGLLAFFTSGAGGL
jgi:hypothetical protein